MALEHGRGCAVGSIGSLSAARRLALLVLASRLGVADIREASACGIRCERERWDSVSRETVDEGAVTHVAHVVLSLRRCQRDLSHRVGMISEPRDQQAHLGGGGRSDSGCDDLRGVVSASPATSSRATIADCSRNRSRFWGRCSARADHPAPHRPAGEGAWRGDREVSGRAEGMPRRRRRMR